MERIFLPLMRMQLPEVRDICMQAEGVFRDVRLARSANGTLGARAK